MLPRAPDLGESDEEQVVSINLNQQDRHEQFAAEDDQDDERTPPSAVVEENIASTSVPNGTVSANESQVQPTVVQVPHPAGPSIGCGGFDDSGILNSIDKLKHTILSAMELSFKDVHKELQTERKQIQELHNHVTSLTSIMTTTASAIFIKQASSNPRVKEIQKTLCLLPALFSDGFMLKVLPRVVVGFVVSNIQSGSSFQALQARGIELLSTLYFSLQQNEKKKEKFSSGVGPIYSKLRHSLLMSSVLAMQSNAFQTFMPEPTQDGAVHMSTFGGEQSSTLLPSMSAILQPFWLKPGFILSKHCTTVAKKVEGGSVAEKGSLTQSTDSSTTSVADTEQMDAQQNTNTTS